MKGTNMRNIQGQALPEGVPVPAVLSGTGTSKSQSPSVAFRGYQSQNNIVLSGCQLSR